MAEVVGFRGEITRDTSKPDGTPRKLMSADKLRAMGWRPSIGLREGIEQVYAGFREDHETAFTRPTCCLDQ